MARSKHIDESLNSKPKVVIVDEDTTFLKMWEKVFRLMNCCNYCITNDPQLARMIAKQGPVDLLISEVVMEKESGFKLAEEVHKTNPTANIVLTTTYNCDLSRFNLKNPHFHILYKPYHSIEDVITFVHDIMEHKDPRKDVDEESWSENEVFPSVMEWKL
jgi:DNA-binding NtrC family response regulator